MKAIIIEDEKRSQQVLKNLITLSCPEVEIVGIGSTVQEGISLIKLKDPDIIFLDIQLNNELGFEIIEQFENLRASIIFTTAYDQYAIKALRLSALDYLMKPIDIDELKSAVSRCYEQNNTEVNSLQLKHLSHNLESKEDPILSVHSTDAIEFINISQIERCEAEGAYSVIILKSGERKTISKVIKELELLLTEFGFARIHQSYLVNLLEIRKYDKKDNLLVLNSGVKLPLARRRKESVLHLINSIKI